MLYQSITILVSNKQMLLKKGGKKNQGTKKCIQFFNQSRPLNFGSFLKKNGNIIKKHKPSMKTNEEVSLLF